MGLVCARQDDQTGTPEPLERLSQTPARKQSPAAERVCPVYGQDVQIARYAKVLESVIEDENLAP
jgi:hypothetical protein